MGTHLVSIFSPYYGDEINIRSFNNCLEFFYLHLK